MDWSREAERIVVQRILALLLGFADLVERADRLPPSPRRVVLIILGYAEMIARRRVMTLALDFGLPLPFDRAATFGTGDAARLAASFRALALLLGAMLEAALHPARLPVDTWLCLPERRLARIFGVQVDPTPAPDTS